MKKVNYPLIIFTVQLMFIWNQPSKAQTGKSEEEEFNAAVKDAQDLLVNQERKNELFKKDANAKAADQNIQALSGGDSALSGEIYQLSSSILAALTKEAQNDPAKLTQLIGEIQKNPNLLKKYLTPAHGNQIRSLSSKIEAKEQGKTLQQKTGKSP